MNFYTNVQLVGDNVLFRGYVNSERTFFKESFSPTLFVSCKDQKSKYKTLDNKYVKPIKFTTVKEAREFVSKYSEVDNFDVYGYERYLYQYIADKYPEDEIMFDPSRIQSVVIDIEVASENGFPDVESAAEEILCITTKNLSTKEINIWTIREFHTDRKDCTVHNCKDEVEMLKFFIGHWVQNTPDVISGWNVKFYDIPYICRRVDRVLSEKWVKSLSPWSRVTERETYVQGRRQISYDILGIAVLDYIDLYRKFTYTNQESYALNHIAMVELGEQKIDHSEYENFKEFYTKDWNKFVEYNIKDVELVQRLDEKMKLLELVFTLAYDAKVNFEDVYSQVKTWDTIIFNYLKKSNLVVPPKKENKKDSQYAGAYVKEPIPGFYDWVVNFDLNSLYPHLIMQYNISPETLLEKRFSGASVDKFLTREIDTSDLSGVTVCANGAMYDTTRQGFLPKLMEKIYEDRTIFKKKMIAAKQQYEKTPTADLKREISRCNNIQMARKIQLNSAYGAIGNEYFRYFRIANAEAITLSGQLSIRWIENKMNVYLNKLLKTDGIDYVIACDTDSMYLNLGPLVDKVFSGREKTSESIVSFLDKISEMELEKYIESSYQELANYSHAYAQKMKMKRENIADRGIWTAKKRYILNVWDSEGVRYSEAKMKIMGLETARSSTPAYYRDKLYEAFKIIMNNDNDTLINFIDKIRIDSRNHDISDISFPRSLNNLQKYKSSADLYKKGTPIQVRGAILYNDLIRKLKLESKYPLIKEGEKIKFVYLKEPNPISENVIAYFQNLPPEFNLNKYIDFDMQFEKSFLEPLKSVLDSIGWKSEQVGTLESFFA